MGRRLRHGNGACEQQIERVLPPFVIGPDGELLSIERGLVQRDVRRLDAPTELGWRGTVTASAFTSDRTQVALAGGDAVRLIDTRSGSVLARFDYESIGDCQAAIAPDGLTVAIKRCRVADSLDASYGLPVPMSVGSRIDIISLETGAIVKTLRSSIEDKCSDKLMFSGGGSRLIEAVSLLGVGAGLRIWDLASGQSWIARLRDSFYRLLPFPDDRTALLVMGADVVRIDFETFTEVARYTPAPSSAVGSAVSPAGDLVMVESMNEVRVWDARSSKLISTFPPVRYGEEAKGVAATAAFSPDGKLLAIAESQSIRLHDPRSGALLRRWPIAKSLSEIQFIDARRLVSADWGTTVTIWDVQSGVALTTDTRARGRTLNLRGVDGVLISASRDTAVRLIPVPPLAH